MEVADMKVLNLHGYKGNSNNTNFRILEDAGYEVISPQTEYDDYDPNTVVEMLSRIIEEEKPELIVATSFGTFFGKILSCKYNIRLIATNPCLRPEISLKRIAPDYFKEGFEAEIVKYVFSNEHRGYKEDTFIIGNNDEVIDHNRITMNEAALATLIIVEGKHRLDRKNYEEILMKEITR